MGRQLSLFCLRGKPLHLEAEANDRAGGVMDQIHQSQRLKLPEVPLNGAPILDRITLLHTGSLIDRWQAGDVLPAGLGALQQTPQGVGEIVVQIRSAVDS